ncbi:MAG: DUF1449 domain-containing protein [Oceanospirillaceae bacterium]|mgnify:CR=1 FL=1|uniref:OB-fold-containig protein n=1 Tax=unclassified Thalassolituus TaxID=2624967 RepID=UPI000C5BCA5E|nr:MULTISPECIES: OB-fold-containig protein [unclassified Thalassolituus]MAS24162.1 DUF1449 domain-containing protein [Oceanospirillaceae bacterium]MAX99677.1 DUF1449 domain-containing protein [Oceanospirillaceae bacterium]MBL35426.1 DUF1449 domain-containing protein [Oceanospirillaceae bacterium]MBS51891.1 DUF1449 domain-containing protein [Oceanospirillaceae bacterium]|tara:strand:+ start:1170 stop:1859 length:690 start_codon:yes stop_codon:yes gene_type:complete
MFFIFLTDGMNPFYQNIASFPTAIYTFLLAICVLYWLVAVLGWIDIDVLDFDPPEAEGNLDINTSHNHSTADALAGLMLRFGLTGVPVTVIVSLISLFGWLICYYLVHFLFAFIPHGLLHWLAGVPIFFAALYGAVLITAQVIKPLRSFFQKTEQNTQKRVLGQTAVVRTSRVDENFGEATLADGGAGLILKVRASAGESFAHGDRVVLLEYLPDDNAYRVISEADFSS